MDNRACEDVEASSVQLVWRSVHTNQCIVHVQVLGCSAFYVHCSLNIIQQYIEYFVQSTYITEYNLNTIQGFTIILYRVQLTYIALDTYSESLSLKYTKNNFKII